MNQVEQRIIHNNIRNAPRIHSLNVNHKKLRSLLVSDYNGIEIISVDKVQYIQSNGNYSEIIILNDKAFICSKTLKTFEHLLPLTFFRIHHQYIVNKSFIKRIENSGKVILHDGTELAIARSRKKSFMKWFIDSTMLVVE